MRDPAWPLKAIRAHAEAAYPDECCGLVLEDGSYLPAPNVARDRSSTYVLDPTTLLAHATSLRAVVHSHCDAPSRFSDEDRRQALAAPGAPLWPGVQYLVTSVERGLCVEARIYAWDPAAGDFREVQFLDFRQIF
jgi:proteasome lid subunit RPN8/RPN11